MIKNKTMDKKEKLAEIFKEMSGLSEKLRVHLDLAKSTTYSKLNELGRVRLEGLRRPELKTNDEVLLYYLKSGWAIQIHQEDLRFNWQVTALDPLLTDKLSTCWREVPDYDLAILKAIGYIEIMTKHLDKTLIG